MNQMTRSKYLSFFRLNELKCDLIVFIITFCEIADNSN